MASHPISHQPQARIDHWTEILRQKYGIGSHLQPLGGSEDTNFLVLDGDDPVGVLKVFHRQAQSDWIEMQTQALAHWHTQNSATVVPHVIPTKVSGGLLNAQDETGADRMGCLLSLITGTCYAAVRPHPMELLDQLGKALADTLRALSSFEHPALDRGMEWSLLAPDWLHSAVSEIDDQTQRQWVEDVLAMERSWLRERLLRLPAVPIHGDVNDYNVMVDREGVGPWQIKGLIDLGDMHRAPAVCELGVAAAYALMDQAQPVSALCRLVAAFHNHHPLSEEELELVFPLVLLRLAMSVVHAEKNSKQHTNTDLPDDPYQVISKAPAWELLGKLRQENSALITARLRMACGLPAFGHAQDVEAFLSAGRGAWAPVLKVELGQARRVCLGVAESTIPRDPQALTEDEALHLVSTDSPAEDPIHVGYYLEPRLVYTEPAYRSGSHPADDRRTVHIGVDVFAPEGTEVHAPLPGKVHVVQKRPERLDYGAVVLLEHTTPSGANFYTLYGHMQWSSVKHLASGDTIEQGGVLGVLGSAAENGGWTPHLHFQLSLTTEGLGQDWPAVCLPDETSFWAEVCPNPAALLNLPDSHLLYPLPDTQTQLAERKRVLGGSVRLSYAQPVALSRGYGSYVYDAMGRGYLDAFNNVPHVGHAHKRLEAVYAKQAARINTNTRYLQDAQVQYADRILSRLPKTFTKCFFVNSGSEANELALRLAHAHTGQRGIVVQDHAYHGNTNAAVAMSPYKFNGPGGPGAPDWVSVCAVADPYRGPFGYDDPQAGEHFAADVDRAIAELQAKSMGVAACILETFPSVGGQIIPPDGYIRGVFARIRAAGGLCIADEVQTSFARLGRYFWAFEQQDAVPDIVVLGKPIGAGHPLGVVVTTEAIAKSFDNGMEFFSTFGGSTLSCAIGSEVFDIVQEENLGDRAERCGHVLLSGFRDLMAKHTAIGDVRGLGLFLGIELVKDRTTQEPAAEFALYVTERMRARRILIGTDGPYHNVLKIRPPLSFNEQDAQYLLSALDSVLSELPCR